MPEIHDTEPRYTLDEAKKRIAEEHCAVHGHDFEYLINGAGALIRVYCGVCGDAWRVEPV